MNPAVASVQRLEIQSPRRLADILKIAPVLLSELGESAAGSYSPYLACKPPRPFERNYTPKPRPIDNPLHELKWVRSVPLDCARGFGKTGQALTRFAYGNTVIENPRITRETPPHHAKTGRAGDPG